jgi:hypothetical protein
MAITVRHAVPVRVAVDELLHAAGDLARNVRDRCRDGGEGELLGGAGARGGGLVEVRGVGRVEGAEVGGDGPWAVDGGLRPSVSEAAQGCCDGSGVA